jgi:hypothetical protein
VSGELEDTNPGMPVKPFIDPVWKKSSTDLVLRRSKFPRWMHFLLRPLVQDTLEHGFSKGHHEGWYAKAFEGKQPKQARK